MFAFRSIAILFAATRVVVGRMALASRRARAAFGGRLGSLVQRLDPDVVLLVGTLDLGSKGLRDAVGDLELGSGVHDADGADVLLVDAAATTDHRQQPARFRVLSPSDGGAKPHAAVRHAVTRR